MSGSTSVRERPGATRVGLFGLLGMGNIGNDACLESMVRYLRADHPDAVLDAMCTGPERLRSHYGIDAVPLAWYQKHEQRVSGLAATALKAVGKGIDAFRTAAWVRRHDVVIVPGMGVLEATVPMRAWWTPYSMLLVCASGRIFGTKVALVSVGANVIREPLMKRMFASAARLAFYRSYRDALSRDAMRQAGVDTENDQVYPDLAFALSVPPGESGVTGSDHRSPPTVGVGVMAYYGANCDRGYADQLHASYVEKMERFVRWLVDSGHRVRMFGGDNNDDDLVHEILADVRAHRPDLDPTWVVAEIVTTFDALVCAIAPVDTAVAIRYHNVLCALKLSKPTLSIGYAAKHNALMADMGLSEFCQSARTLDVDQLIEQFKELESRSGRLRQTMAERNAEKVRLLDHQFAELSRLLFPADEPVRPVAEHEPVDETIH